MHRNNTRGQAFVVNEPAIVEGYLIDAHVDTVSFRVEHGKIAEFVKACGMRDQVHVDLDSARQRGLKDIAATPTHVVVAGHQREPKAILAEFGINYKRVVVGGSSWSYNRPAVAGEQLTGRRVVSADDIRKNRQGQRLRILELTTEFTGGDGDIVVIQRETIIERSNAS